MPYVPQFVQTDLSALQGIMNQSQAKYDYNTKQSDDMANKLAEMSATNAFDQQQKDTFRNKLKEEVARLDKTYNYDRSSGQYAKELSNTLTNIKGDPYFGYKVKADKLEEQRRAMQLQLKGDYFETTKPFDEKLTTLADRQKALDNWGVLSLKDLESGVTEFGKGYAAGDYQGVITDPTLVDGYTRVMNQLGAKNMGAAANELRNNPILLEQSVKGTGFEGHMDDPKVRDRAINALLSSMVGKQSDQWLADREPIGGSSSGGGKGGPTSPTMQVSTQSAGELANPYPITTIKDVDNLKDKIARLDPLVNDEKRSDAERNKYRQDRLQLQIELEDVESARNRYEKAEPRVFDVGRSRIEESINEAIKKGAPLMAGTGISASEDIIQLWKNFYTETKGIGRAVSGSVNDELVPAIRKALTRGQKTNVSESEITNLSMELADMGKQWYKGHGKFPKSLSYENAIQDPLNKELEEGKKAQWDVTAPTIDSTSTEYKQLVDGVLLNLRHTLPKEKEYRKGEGVEWDTTKLAETEAFMRLPGTSVNFLFDNKNRAFIQMYNPGTKAATKDQKNLGAKTATVEIDPKRSSYDMLVNLSQITGEKRFLDVAYQGFNLTDDKS
jgi:hypothetical protein